MALFKKQRGLFFWKRTESEKAEDMLKIYLKFLPELRKIQNANNPMGSDGEIIGRMYDFFADYGGTLSGHTVDDFDGLPDGDIVANPVNLASSYTKKEDKRKVATPLSVVNELERVPVPFTIENLDHKISVLKDKSLLSHQRYVKHQIDGLTKRLENRKQYRENFPFYSTFPNTTDEKIDDLLSKYKLVMKTSDLFVPTFPDEAVTVMKEYTKVTQKLSGEKPVFYVIAEEKDFEKKYKKLDPILLVQSPFGFYWQILGAWDKEMLLLTEL